MINDRFFWQTTQGVSAKGAGRHPCYDGEAAGTYARIHLPVAPRCNVQCRFCDRKFSCVNESRPGVTADILSPARAIERLEAAIGRMPNISVVGIAGPGDPFANPEETLDTFRLIRQSFPDLMLCVSTNGLNLLPYVDDIVRLGVSHVTVTVNAVESAIGKGIYEWVLKDGKQLHGEEAAAWLWDRQRKAILALAGQRVIVKVNTVCVPGVNDGHVSDISRTVAALGASLHNIIPLIPVPGTPFAGVAEPSRETMAAIRATARAWLPQMEHCSRCRADAVGLLSPGPNSPVAVERIVDDARNCPAASRCSRGCDSARKEADPKGPGCAYPATTGNSSGSPEIVSCPVPTRCAASGDGVLAT